MIDWKGELFEWMPGCIGIFRHDGKCLRTVALNAKMRDILGGDRRRCSDKYL